MKIGIIIPDRGDRPLFTLNCKRIIKNQTIQPEIVLFVDFKPENKAVDITKRYRIGYEYLRNKGLDVIFFMENDDYYAPNYLETMLKAWENAGKPALFGTTKTIYYHIKLRKHYTMHHVTRSSAMSTMIKPDLKFNWCADYNPYTDCHLYEVLPYKLFTPDPDKPICIGIKHGIGMTGGHGHATRLDAYDSLSTSANDPEMSWLRDKMDGESFDFYSRYFNSTILPLSVF
jgi:hypothetical protein